MDGCESSRRTLNLGLVCGANGSGNRPSECGPCAGKLARRVLWGVRGVTALGLLGGQRRVRLPGASQVDLR